MRHTALALASDALHESFTEYDQAVIEMIKGMAKKGMKPKEIEQTIAKKMLELASGFITH
jgi:hypothetical protein